MTRPFEFLQFTDYPLYRLLSDEFFCSLTTKPKRDYVPSSELGPCTSQETFNFGIMFSFEKGSVRLHRNHAIEIYDSEKNKKFSCRFDKEFSYIYAENFHCVTGSTGRIESKMYSLPSYQLHMPHLGKPHYQWQYGDNSYISIDRMTSRHQTIFMMDASYIVEISNKKGRVSSCEMRTSQPDDTHTAKLEYNRNGVVEFTSIYRNNEWKLALPNIPGICPSYFWNDEYMFQVLLTMPQDVAERFEYLKEKFEESLDESISSGYHVPYSIAMKKLIDMEKSK